MTFLPLDRPTTADTAFDLTKLRDALLALLPQRKPIDGDKALRLNTLRAEARANADRLLR